MKTVSADGRNQQVISKVCGILWDKKQDSSMIRSPNPEVLINAKTKREVLVVIASVYDPLRYPSLAMTKMKVFLQRLWEEGKDWDNEMTSGQSKEWIKSCSNLDGITEIAVPRYVGNENCWLLGFVDGSKDGFTTIVYLCTSNFGKISTHLLYSMTNLAPRKISISLRRLELLAVFIGIRCMRFVAKEINLTTEKKIIWTDSQCLLNWVKTNKPLSIFVKNHIDEIRSEPDIVFKYTSTNDNPADIPTRGESITELKLRILRWKGPKWITSYAENWTT